MLVSVCGSESKSITSEHLTIEKYAGDNVLACLVLLQDAEEMKAGEDCRLRRSPAESN